MSHINFDYTIVAIPTYHPILHITLSRISYATYHPILYIILSHISSYTTYHPISHIILSHISYITFPLSNHSHSHSLSLSFTFCPCSILLYPIFSYHIPLYRVLSDPIKYYTNFSYPMSVSLIVSWDTLCSIPPDSLISHFTLSEHILSYHILCHLISSYLILSHLFPSHIYPPIYYPILFQPLPILSVISLRHLLPTMTPLPYYITRMYTTSSK